MAALAEPPPHGQRSGLVELRNLRAVHLDRLLEEETAAWRQKFEWDFGPSSTLIRRFIDQQALGGFAMVEGGEVAGYAYYVVDDRKGLVGDLFVGAARRTGANENRLLSATVGALMETPFITRIETQLMLLGGDAGAAPPAQACLRKFPRQFMRAQLGRASQLPPAPVGPRIACERWTDRHQELAAHLIPLAYQSHADSDINDQYRTAAGARRFLYNIVQYPGCGSFFRPGSCVAVDRETGMVCGLSLTSLVSPASGHITQLCVAPEMRGRKLGYELLRYSLRALEEAGCRSVSLTVTSSNREAIALYERTGFTVAHRFFAYVWEGF
jgi:ribosomal protein S18 acetylase RimI-like enzyme